jgi:hypothetical protein
MLNQEFCNFLEYHITGTLTKSADLDRRRCWCDGILMPGFEKDYSVSKIKSTKQIITRAWIDEGRIKGKERGQFIYELTISFGDKSIQHYIKGLDLTECVPDKNNDDWIMLDREKRKIEIQLL